MSTFSAPTEGNDDTAERPSVEEKTSSKRITSSLVGQLDQEEFSWSAAVGGPRGIVESVAPACLFLAVFVPTRHLVWALVAACALAAVMALLRLIQRQPLIQALSGLLGVGVSVFLAAWTGRGEDFFVWGLVSSTLFASVLAVSALLRRPLVGVALHMVWSLPSAWWNEPKWQQLVRRCHLLTWAWAGLFLLRVGAQFPLWWTGNVAALGVVKLALGLPPFLLLAWVTWLVLRPLTPQSREEEPPLES